MSRERRRRGRRKRGTGHRHDAEDIAPCQAKIAAALLEANGNGQNTISASTAQRQILIWSSAVRQSLSAAGVASPLALTSLPTRPSHLLRSSQPPGADARFPASALVCPAPESVPPRPFAHPRHPDCRQFGVVRGSGGRSPADRNKISGSSRRGSDSIMSRSCSWKKNNKRTPDCRLVNCWLLNCRLVNCWLVNCWLANCRLANCTARLLCE